MQQVELVIKKKETARIDIQTRAALSEFAPAPINFIGYNFDFKNQSQLNAFVRELNNLEGILYADPCWDNTSVVKY